jgi:hydrogenase maturation protease
VKRGAVIVGLGSEVRTDDGVGLAVIRRLEETGTPDGIELVAAGTPGLGILDLIAGFRRAVIVDAIDAGLDPGTVIRQSVDDLSPASLHASVTHGIDLVTALETGRKLGLPLPDELHIVAIQIEDATTLSESCTQAVEAAIDEASNCAVKLASQGA